MTISLDRGAELTVSQLVLKAYQLIGVMNTAQGTDDPNWVADEAFGKVLLDTVIDELQTEGCAARSVVFYNLPMVVGTAKYNMPTTCLDVIGNGMYIFASQTDLDKAMGELLVEPITRDDWQIISNKASTGRPMRYWVNVEPSPAEVRIWPLPTELGHIRFQIVQLYADTLEGNKTIELQQYWIQYLLWELGAQLASAKSLPVQRCRFYASKAQALRKRARAYSAQHMDTQLSITHRTPWSI